MKVVESHRDLIQHAEDRLAAWRALSENEARNAEEARTKVARLANYRGVLDCE
jgi:hypothetical protein